jgi:hypothetical protein
MTALTIATRGARRRAWLGQLVGSVRLAAAGVEVPSTIVCLFVRAQPGWVCTHFGWTVRARALAAITKLVRSISIADRSARSHAAVMPLIRGTHR